MAKLYGGIEAGGTKFVCAVGMGPDQIFAEQTIPTTTPEQTLEQTISFFKEQGHGPISAIGIASFGPLDPDPNSPTYGYITATPKPGWSHTDFVGPVRKKLEIPVGFDTDVNVAALGEWRWGVARDLAAFIYLTIGTGIGGGGLVNGGMMHGLIHPEMGHIRIPHDINRDPFPGVCPFHGDCFEGLANGPAIERRWGQSADTLPEAHPAWELEAHYLALALVNFICTLSPERIIMGGGVMQQLHLFPMIRENVLRLLNNYVQSPKILDGIDQYIVPPRLGNRAGVLGAIALAMEVDRRN